MPTKEKWEIAGIVFGVLALFAGFGLNYYETFQLKKKVADSTDQLNKSLLEQSKSQKDLALIQTGISRLQAQVATSTLTLNKSQIDLSKLQAGVLDLQRQSGIIEISDAKQQNLQVTGEFGESLGRGVRRVPLRVTLANIGREPISLRYIMLEITKGTLHPYWKYRLELEHSQSKVKNSLHFELLNSDSDLWAKDVSYRRYFLVEIDQSKLLRGQRRQINFDTMIADGDAIELLKYRVVVATSPATSGGVWTSWIGTGPSLGVYAPTSFVPTLSHSTHHTTRYSVQLPVRTMAAPPTGAPIEVKVAKPAFPKN